MSAAEKQILFSVIVPVYNAAATLEKCAESILAQLPQSAELILVDDGSADASPALCDALAAKDGRVKALHRQNGGASAARNTGLDAARGRYLQFVDADDWLKPGLYPAAQAAMEAGADVFFFGVENVGAPPDPPLPAADYTSLAALKDDFEHYLVTTGQFASPCNKVYRAAAVGENRFDPNLQINEDLLFNLQVLAGCGPVRFCPASYYCCDRRRADTLSGKLRTDLLEAEAYIRPAFRAFVQSCGLNRAETDCLEEARLRFVAVAQLAALRSRRGALSLRGYRQAFCKLLADPRARRGLAVHLAADPNRLPALPWRACVALRWVLPMAVFCWARGSTTHEL